MTDAELIENLSEQIIRRDEKLTELEREVESLKARLAASRAIPGVPEGQIAIRTVELFGRFLDMWPLGGPSRNISEVYGAWDRVRTQAKKEFTPSSEPLSSPGNEKESAQPVRHGEGADAPALLRSPTKNAGPCFCPPDRCDAPVIMGRQMPCRDLSRTVKPSTVERSKAEDSAMPKEADSEECGSTEEAAATVAIWKDPDHYDAPAPAPTVPEEGTK